MTERETPFAVLGEEVPPDASAEEALELGGLSGWDVRKIPLIAHDQRHSYIPIPGRFATVRSVRDGGVPGFLGIVGEAYKIRQNEYLVPYLEAFQERVGAVINSAGALASDAEVFVSLKSLSTHPVGDDTIDVYYLMTLNHQGKEAPAVSVLPVSRVTGAVVNPRAGFIPPRHRFRGDVEGSAREVGRYTTRFIEMAEALSSIRVTHSEMEQALQAVFSPSGSGPASTRRRNHMRSVMELYESLEDQGPTAWKGLISLMGWYDHRHPVRDARDQRRARALRAVKNTDQKSDMAWVFLRSLGYRP